MIYPKKELTPNALDIIDSSVDILKDLKTIESMESEYPSEGYSQGYYGRMPYYMYDGDMPNGGRSYAKGNKRGLRGMYYDDNYSGDTKEELHKLMDTAKTDREREAIRSALDHMR